MAFCFFADFFDVCWSDYGGLVAEGVSYEGEDGGDFFVREHFERRHGNDTGVVRAFDFDGALESVEGEFDEAFFAAGDPFAAGDGWELGGGETFAVGLVTSDAMTFSVEDLGAFGEDDLVGSF